MLEDAEEKGYDHIISWAKDGQSFEIHDTAVFSDTVMKDYFKQKHIKSFTRQVRKEEWKGREGRDPTFQS